MVGAFLLWAILLAIVLTFVARGAVVVAILKSGEVYDNAHPRAQQAKLTGLGARANAAHANSFEALIMFAPAALAAFVTGASPATANALAAGFLAARLVYIGLYLGNIPMMRSLVWGVGFVCTVGLLGLAIAAV